MVPFCIVSMDLVEELGRIVSALARGGCRPCRGERRVPAAGSHHLLGAPHPPWGRPPGMPLTFVSSRH